MSSHRKLGFPLHRRDVLKGGATLAGAAMLPIGWNLDAVAAASSCASDAIDRPLLNF